MDKVLFETDPVVLLTGGGTGGHIYPNLALVPELRRHGFDVAYMGGDGPEVALAKEAGLPFYSVPTVKLVRSLFAIKNNLAIPFKLQKAVKAAVEAMSKLSPCAVFSKGGYASLPAVLAASKLHIPLFAHESDLTLGLANRIAAKKGATVLKANPMSKFDGVTVGMPLREELFSVNPAAAKRRLGINTQKPVLLVLGGSSGAGFLNDSVKATAEALTKRYFVLHVCGRQPFVPPVLDDYKCVAYADRVGDFYAAADAVLSRSGATAVYEIAALQKRAVFVPLPKGVSRGDQIDNAALAANYGAYVLPQSQNFNDILPASIEKAFANPPMRPICADSSGKIAQIIYASLRRGEKCKDKKL